ncbi:MAG: sulfotransferase [Pacificimonas sp.]
MSRLIRGANRAFPWLWEKGLAPPPALTADTLIADAVKSAGTDEFGDSDMVVRLERLCEAINSEAGLTPLGRVMSYGGLRRTLIQRLMCEAMLTADPDITERPVSPPIIIVGPMRSGTTRLQRLLACDTRFVSTRVFEALSPVPGRRSARIAETRALQFALDGLNPAVRRIHPGQPLDTEEELPILELALSGAQIESQRPIPSWARWMEQTPQRHAYHWLKRWMQLTGARRGDDPARPWVMKTPQYMQDLPALLGTFPNARLIFIHRDPRAVTASAASLAWNFMLMQSETVTPDWCGREWLHKTAFRIDATRAFRAAHPEVPAVDVRFRDMNADWEAEVARIYDWLDLPEVPFDAMRNYSRRAARRHLTVPHRYSLKDFGLSSAQVDERLGTYAADFDLL